MIQALSAILGFIGLSVAAGYSVLTVVAVLIWRMRRMPGEAAARPPITILKPLCGEEPGLYEHLCTFCRQDYPEYQIVFGLREQSDPAWSVVKRLEEAFPAQPIDIVIDPRLHGDNRKISNLVNMLPLARHDILVMSDSDAFVGPDYLTAVTAPLLDSRVGLVTCIYRGIPTLRLWSRLGAMYINEWYVPSVMLSWLFGYQGYVSGQTVCLRRDTLNDIGGLNALVDELADDYRLGELVHARGLTIELSSYVIDGEHHELSFEALTSHEMRWMRTIHVLRPNSFRGLFLTFSMPLAILGCALVAAGSGNALAAGLLFTASAAARLVLHVVHRIGGARPLFADLWLLPARDLLLCWVWFRSFFTSSVTWRGHTFDVDARGVMRRHS